MTAGEQVQRISTFFKQRGDKFYPAWSFVLPTSVLRLVYSLVESLVFSCITYFIVGLAPTPGRFFRYGSSALELLLLQGSGYLHWQTMQFYARIILTSSHTDRILMLPVRP